MYREAKDFALTVHTFSEVIFSLSADPAKGIFRANLGVAQDVRPGPGRTAGPSEDAARGQGPKEDATRGR